MQNSPPLFLLILTLAGVLGLVSIIKGYRQHSTTNRRRIALVTILPGIVFLGLFYSLAIHMHKSLGGWPTYIGNRGFTSSLNTHAEIALQYFGILLMISALVLPVAFVVCILIRRCQGVLFGLGVFALSSLACFVAVMLAPPEFLYWWWD